MGTWRQMLTCPHPQREPAGLQDSRTHVGTPGASGTFQKEKTTEKVMVNSRAPSSTVTLAHIHTFTLAHAHTHFHTHTHTHIQAHTDLLCPLIGLEVSYCSCQSLGWVLKLQEVKAPREHTQRERERERGCVADMSHKYACTHTHTNTHTNTHTHSRISACHQPQHLAAGAKERLDDWTKHDENAAPLAHTSSEESLSYSTTRYSRR